MVQDVLILSKIEKSVEACLKQYWFFLPEFTHFHPWALFWGLILLSHGCQRPGLCLCDVNTWVFVNYGSHFWEEKGSNLNKSLESSRPGFSREELKLKTFPSWAINLNQKSTCSLNCKWPSACLIMCCFLEFWADLYCLVWPLLLISLNLSFRRASSIWLSHLKGKNVVILKFTRTGYSEFELIFGFCGVHLNTPIWIVIFYSFSQLGSVDSNVYI